MGHVLKHAHADDYGLNPSTNKAIKDLCTNNQLESLSLITTFDAFGEASKHATKAPVDVFLHFNLTEGFPLSPANQIPSLVDENGQFYNQLKFMWRCIVGKVAISEVHTELEKQYNKARDNGVRISGIDSHQHVHAFHPVASVVYDFAKEKSLPNIRSYKQVHTHGVSAYIIKLIYQILARISGRGRLPVSWQRSSWKNYIMATWQDTRLYKGDTTVVIHPGTNYDRQEGICRSLLRHVSHVRAK